jgi:hypothetical protein
MVFCFKSSFLSSKDDSLISNSAFFPMTKYTKYIQHYKTKLVLFMDIIFFMKNKWSLNKNAYIRVR